MFIYAFEECKVTCVGKALYQPQLHTTPADFNDSWTSQNWALCVSKERINFSLVGLLIGFWGFQEEIY